MKNFPPSILIVIFVVASLISWFLHSRSTINFTEDSRSVESKDLSHLYLLSNLVDGHTGATGMVPENIVDTQGNPLLSWRVMVLQYGCDEEVAQFNEFKLDEPWNSEYNLKAAKKIPVMYLDPAGTKYTPYLGVTGKTTAFGQPRSIDEDKDRTHAAIVIADTSKVKIFWSEPKDLPLQGIEDKLRWYVNRTRFMDTLGYVNSWEKGKNFPSFEFSN